MTMDLSYHRRTIHVAIVWIMGKNANEGLIAETANKVAADLRAGGLSVVVDTRDYKPGFWVFPLEQRGVPVRLELGQRDIDSGAVMFKERTSSEKGKLNLIPSRTHWLPYGHLSG